MGTLKNLVIRNMKVYLRNRSNIFFSFLTMIIILLLNTVFLGGVNKEHLSGLLPISEKMITYVTGSWLMAGLIVVNVFMVISVMLGIMVEDEEQHRLIAFMVAPVSRITLTLSYIIAAMIVSFGFAVITLLISQVYLWWECREVISLISACKITALALLNIFSIVSIIMCVVTLIRSSSSYGAFNTMMGSVIGFIAGIYLPIGSLPTVIQNGLKVFPILHGTALMREVYTADAIAKGFAGAPEAMIEGYKAYMGITIYFGDEKSTMWLSSLILLLSGIIFMSLAGFLVSKKQTRDR